MPPPVQNAILIPSEEVPDLREIKVTLLSFDSVHLPDPADRDIIPRNALMSAVIGLPLMGIDTGPINPLGKAPGFDDRFQALYDSLRPAISTGHVVIDPSIQPTPGRMTIGGVDIGAGVPNPLFVFHVFRMLAARADVLATALHGTGLEKASADDLGPLALTQLESVSGTPDLARLPHPDHDVADMLRKIAAARIATVCRFIATADFRDLQPIAADPGLRAVLDRLLLELRSVQEGGPTEDVARLQFLHRLHDVVLRSYLDDEKLADLTIDDILRMRTRAWGSAQEARAALLLTLQDLSDEVAPADFEKACQEAFDSYFKASADFRHEAKKFALNTTLTTSLVGVAVAERGIVEGLIHGLTGVPGAALLAISAVGLNALKELAPQAFDLYRDARARHSSHGYALAKPYGKLVRPRKS